MPAKPPDESQPQNDPNWIRRQWQRVRNVRRRDIVIAQVGQGARNIVVGTRNIQINVADRNLTLPVLLVPILLLIIIGYLVYPALEPLWNPAKMTGQFRIAVAQFGEIGTDGHVHSTRDGEVLSRWLFDGLMGEYLKNADVELADAIEIWHDSRTDTPQNFKFGVMSGDTDEERQAAAAHLASRIDAHMVIYGNLITDPAAAGLDLEFYLSPLVNDETAAIVGAHRLGKLLPLPLPFETGSPEANVAVAEKLKVRADALFWLTIGLTQQLLGRSDSALETFQQGVQELVDWPESDGKEILYFFIGRELLFLDRMDEAEASLREALRIAPDYARAQVALGSVYQRRAQDVAPEKRLEEPRALEQAIEYQRQGLNLALDSGDPLLEVVARIALAKSYRLLGETYDFLDNVEEASRQYDLAVGEIDQATALLASMRQYRLLAQAYETQGAAYLQQGLLLAAQQQAEGSRASLERARAAYQNCVDQGAKAPFDRILQDQVIGQGCRHFYDRTVEFLQSVEGGG
jgi:tetratricopeptide (TPR) repeat protein